ncbi:Fur family transcriptional regulator [Ornithinimicrobium sp. Y1694]|uniref:Fur family transcriptional regulator n=1 Tax=Ornithinimicrobium sp. Y1694 TaxID=3418590 RepID=UPI003CEEAC5F
MPTPSEVLTTAGLRVTGPRVAVLEALLEHPHADAAEVLRRSRERAASVSVQGVYDVLGTLLEARVIRRIQPARSVARFEVDHGDNHHHAVCRGCETLVDVGCLIGAAPCLDPAPAHAVGFSVDQAEVIYWGLCPTCGSAAEGHPQNSPTVPPVGDTPEPPQHDSHHPHDTQPTMTHEDTKEKA